MKKRTGDEQATVRAVFLHDGYSRSTELTGWYRDLTVREAKQLSYGTSLYCIDKHGNVRSCRLNGAPKTWKTRPGCRLSLKYGLREYFTVGDDCRIEDAAVSTWNDVRVVVRVNQQFEPETPQEVVTDWVMEHELTAQV